MHPVATSAGQGASLPRADDSVADAWRDLRAVGWWFVAFLAAGFLTAGALLVVVVKDGVAPAKPAACIDDDPLRAPYMPAVGVAAPACR